MLPDGSCSASGPWMVATQARRFSTVPDLDHDWRLRLAAFARLNTLRDRKGGSDLVTAAEIAGGFEFEGERIDWLIFVAVSGNPGRRNAR